MIVNNNSIKPINFEGLQIFDYTNGNETSSSLAVIQVPPGIQHRKAWSKRSDKYYYLMDGQIRFTLDEEDYDLVKGDCCLVKQGQRFRYENLASEVATFILIHTPSFDLASEVFLEEE